MIRDVIILNNGGVPLFYQNFGQCHSFGDDVALISGFISAIQSFSEELVGTDLSLVQMGSKQIAFHKNEHNTYALICDVDDRKDEISTKARKLCEVFENEYKKELASFDGNTDTFSGFGTILVNMNITRKNCGGRPECEGCDNSSKSLPLRELIRELTGKHSPWQRVKARFRRRG